MNQSLYTENLHKKVPPGNYKHGEAIKKASHEAGGSKLEIKHLERQTDFTEPKIIKKIQQKIYL